MVWSSSPRCRSRLRARTTSQEVAERCSRRPAIWIPALVVDHFGTDPPLLLDPFAGGGRVQTEAPQELVRPWRANEVAMRMLNNLVLAYQRRGDIGDAIHAARLRLTLPTEASHRDILQAQLRTMQARLN